MATNNKHLWTTNKLPIWLTLSSACISVTAMACDDISGRYAYHGKFETCSEFRKNCQNTAHARVDHHAFGFSAANATNVVYAEVKKIADGTFQVELHASQPFPASAQFLSRRLMTPCNDGWLTFSDTTIGGGGGENIKTITESTRKLKLANNSDLIALGALNIKDRFNKTIATAEWNARFKRLTD